MSTANRILTNTLITYTRTIFSAVCTLFSSRWVLQSLGVSDFGLFYLVGSVIVFISFLNSVMSISASRHFAFELGRGIKDETQKWFNTALSIHLLLPILLIIVGYPLGTYLIRNVFDILPDRIDEAILVFKFSLVSAFFGMLSVPYIAMYTAKQRFIELSIIGIILSILTLSVAYSLLVIPGDKLLIYAILMATINVLVYSIQILRAAHLFSECKIKFSYWRNHSRFKELTTFALWNLIGNFGHLIRTQGLTLITNLYFGTHGNAALGISNQLSTQTSALTNALSQSVTPEIIRSEAMGDTKRAVKLSFQSTKLGIYFILMLTIPLLIETDYILSIWLTTVPKDSVILCQLIIIMFMIEKSTLGHIPLLQAVNKISKPQISLGIIFTFTLAIALFLIELGLGIASIGWASIISMTFSRVSLAYWATKYFNIPFKTWIKRILVPYLVLIIVSLIVSHILTLVMREGFNRLILIFGINTVLISYLSWIFLLDTDEKVILRRKLDKVTIRSDT